MTLYLLAANATVCAVVFSHAVCVLRQLTRRDDWLYLCAYPLLAIAAFSVAIGPLYGYLDVQWSEVFYNAAAGTLIMRTWWRHGRWQLAINQGRLY